MIVVGRLVDMEKRIVNVKEMLRGSGEEEEEEEGGEEDLEEIVECRVQVEQLLAQ